MEKHENNIQEELKGEAPFLSGLPRKEPFRVPENYFEELPAKVQDRINARKPAAEAPWLEWLMRRRWVSLSAAAVLALFFSIALYLYTPEPAGMAVTNDPTVETAGQEAALTDAAVLEYIDEETLEEELMALAEGTAPAGDDETEEEVLEEYLIDHTSELELLEL